MKKVIRYEFLRSGKILKQEEIMEIEGLLRTLTDKSVTVSPRQLEKIIEKTHLLLARDGDKGGKIIGMATLVAISIPTGEIGRIEDVVVNTSYRGQGIGKRLINKLIIKAKELKLKRIDLTSNPTRMEANQMYKKMGFETVQTNVYRMKLL